MTSERDLAVEQLLKARRIPVPREGGHSLMDESLKEFLYVWEKRKVGELPMPDFENILLQVCD